MALDNYSNLKTAVLAWTERPGDEAAAGIIDDCVTLCEARINKTPDLRLGDMETVRELTLEDEKVALPSDFLAAKRVMVQSNPQKLLQYAEPGWYQGAFPFASANEGCGFYTIFDGFLRAKTASTLSLLYYASLPPLVSAGSNWLLRKAPDVYLYGTICELLNALEGNSTQKYLGLFGASVEALINSETFSRGGVLTMRASMPAP